MVLNDTQRRLLERLQSDRARKETFTKIAQHDIEAAVRYLEITYGVVQVTRSGLTSSPP